jgi:Family of unknown function (DUF6448)
MKTTAFTLILGAIITALFNCGSARAHCDTLDGPVVQAAKEALQKGDVTPVLKWVKPDDEKAIRDAFIKAVKVRALGDEARELADHHFFETLVRVHRAGEGVAFTGLKPAGEVDPGIAAADKALQHGSAKELAHHMAEEIEEQITKRFAAVSETAKHAEQSVEAGRAYVAAYVEFIHYVEALASLTSAQHAHLHEGEHAK